MLWQINIYVVIFQKAITFLLADKVFWKNEHEKLYKQTGH